MTETAKECRWCRHWSPTTRECSRITDGRMVWGRFEQIAAPIHTQAEFGCILFEPREKTYTELRLEAEKRRAGLVELVDHNNPFSPAGFWPSIDEQLRRNRELTERVEQLTATVPEMERVILPSYSEVERRRQFRREVATAALQGLMHCGAYSITPGFLRYNAMIDDAVAYADALLKKLEEPDAKS